MMFSRIGLGAGNLGSVSDAEADRLVRAALALGVTVFDTARSYGASEARLGRALAERRNEAIVVTKGGYGVDGVADWTGEAIRRGVDEALSRLGGDAIDVFLLHSCDVATLERGDVVPARVRARDAGKGRVAGYSGEGAALAWAAARREIFGALECSASPFDQANLPLVARAREESFCVLAKRPLGNAPWRYATRQEREDEAIYWRRWRELGVDPTPLAWEELCVRFTAFAPGVTTALVGTARMEHLEAAVRAAASGPLDAVVHARVRAAFAERGGGWTGVV